MRKLLRLNWKFSVANSLLLTCSSIPLLFKSVISSGALEGWESFKIFLFTAYGVGFFFLIPLILLLLFQGVFFFWNKRARALYLFAFIINFIFLFYLVADSFVFPFYRTHLNWAMVQMTLFGGGRIISFSGPMLFQIACLVLGILIFSWGIVWTAIKISKFKKVLLTLSSLVVLAFIVTNGVYTWASANSDVTTTSVYEKIPFSQPLRMNKRLAKWGLISKEKTAQTRVTESGKGQMNYPLHPLNCSKHDGYNVLFILVDALRFDMLTKEVMPNTYEFGQNNVRFLNHYSNGNHTRDGVFSLFSGLPAQYWEKALEGHTPGILTTAFIKQGYDIGIFTGAPLDLPAFDKTIFSNVPHLTVYPPGKDSVESDALAIDNFQKWQSSLPKDKRFFGFIFLDSVHAYSFPNEDRYKIFKPYLEAINHLELINSYDPAKYLAKYKNAVYYVDSLIQKAIEYLRNNDLLDNTIVIISSDHGEEFNDNKLNFWGHGGNFTDVQAKVPLVVHWPGKKPEKIEYLTSHLDIAPTLLPEVLGCSNPTEDYSVGQSIWEKDRHRNWVYAHGYTRGGFIEKDRIAIINKAGALEFLDKSYRPSKINDIPGYLPDALKENAKYLK